MPSFPSAHRLDLVENLQGRPVADPYRWLEDAASADTISWRQAQDTLCGTVLNALPGREQLRARLSALLSAGAAGPPVWRAGRAFWTLREPGQEHAVLWWRDADGTARPLLDPVALDPTGLTTLDAWSPSLEGTTLAYQLSTGGDEESVLHVIDVGSSEHLDGPIDRCRYSPVAWEPGGAALYYVRRLAPDLVPAGEEQFHRRVYRHVVGTDPGRDAVVWGQGQDLSTYYDCSLSRDGRWLVVSASVGTAPRQDVWLFDVSAGGPPAEIQVGVDARCAAWVDHDGRLWMLTDGGAARGRLCSADPAHPADRTTVLAEDPEAVLADVALLADGRVVVLRSRHALSELTVLHGDVESPIPLPGVGTCTALTVRPEGGSEVWLGWTDTVTPQQVHHWDARTGRLTLWQRAPGGPDLPVVHSRLTQFASRDGTTVRALVLSPVVAPDRPRPTVLYGYGGFGVALTPTYTALALAWVAAGGVWVIANLRGGSEEGEQWHRAGMREHKQNVFDDLAACADHLVEAGWTSSAQLAIYGGSNGGLLVGAALTQRPASYAAVVCSAPLLDMVRYEQFGLGRTWNDEYGRACDPVELSWLLGYSPYHHVTDGARYPAVLFTVFDGDSRVDPLHARKLCAALQHATSGAAPVLLRDEKGVGHGARSVSRSVELGVDVLAFLAAHTGLGLAPP